MKAIIQRVTKASVTGRFELNKCLLHWTNCCKNIHVNISICDLDVTGNS